MSRDFQSLFSGQISSGGGGSSGNAIVANASSRLFFSYQPLLLNNGQEGSHDSVLDIPYVAVPFTISKEQLTAAIASVTIPGSVVSARLVHIRNNQQQRAFNVNWAGSGQIQSPALNNPVVSASISGISAVPGKWYEMAATYVDGAGTTHIGTAVPVLNSGQDMSAHTLKTVVYEVNNPTFNLTVDNAVSGISFSETAVVTVVPYDTVSGKHAGSFDVVLGPVGQLTAAHDYNNPPVPYQSGSGSGSNCEFCWGIDIGGGNMFRTSSIHNDVQKQFYGGDGWSGQNNEFGTDWTHVGSANLLLVGNDTTKLVAARVQFFWRPNGQSSWTTRVEFTDGHNHISGYTRVDPDRYGQGQMFQEQATFPVNGFSGAQYIWINHSSVSSPLSLNGRPGPAHTYAKDAGGNFRKLANSTPSTVSRQSWHQGVPESQRPQSYDSDYITRLNLHMPTPARVSTPGFSTPGAPLGDEFYLGPLTFKIAASVAAHGNATRSDFYVREVTRQLNGTLVRGDWKQVAETDRVNQFSVDVTEIPSTAATVPTANTTNTYANSYLGTVAWGTGSDEPIQFQVGDAFRLQNVQHSFPQLGMPAKFDISMEFTLAG